MKFYPTAVLLALALAGCTAIDRPPAQSVVSSSSIKVATWNLEHLAEADGAGCRPRTAANYAELRRHAARLGADVIAFQEVESRAAAERVFDPAIYDVVISSRPRSGRGGGCFDRPGQTFGHQATGFAIRKGLRWTRNPDVRELGLGNPDLRWGVDITIEGRKPLRLLSVHLKAGCNSGKAPSDKDCPVLFDQLPVLKHWIDARVTAGQPYAVLGDWNRRLDATGDLFFDELDRTLPAAADLTTASAGRPATCKVKYREFIDHIVTGSAVAAMLVPGSFAEYTYGVAENDHPSDHCPVSVRVLRP